MQLIEVSEPFTKPHIEKINKLKTNLISRPSKMFVCKSIVYNSTRYFVLEQVHCMFLQCNMSQHRMSH